MIKAYSQRVLNPYTGYVQIAESERARAVSFDGEVWEMHFINTVIVKSPQVTVRKKSLLTRIADFFRPVETAEKEPEPAESKRAFARVGRIKLRDMQDLLSSPAGEVDERILEMTGFLVSASLPFPANDRYEYWLLDRNDGLPLALLFSCATVEEQSGFRSNADWTALPAAIMPIEKSEDEMAQQLPPVNSRFERLVAEYAGLNAKGRWFERREGDTEEFPPLMVKEDWQHETERDLCQRYLQRLSSRLLMLHDLSDKVRKRVEHDARSQALEVAKFFPLYPSVNDDKVMNSIRVEARLRETRGEESHSIKFPWS